LLLILSCSSLSELDRFEYMQVHITRRGGKIKQKENTMAKLATSPLDSAKEQINYQLIRNVTSPEEKANGVQTYFLNVPAHEIADIGTSENLRSYIAEHSARKRNAVHKAIESTILN